jgi:hypothetical protein
LGPRWDLIPRMTGWLPITRNVTFTVSRQPIRARNRHWERVMASDWTVMARKSKGERKSWCSRRRTRIWGDENWNGGIYIDGSRYKATTAEDKLSAVMRTRVRELARALWLRLFTICNISINPVINPNLGSSQRDCIFMKNYDRVSKRKAAPNTHCKNLYWYFCRHIKH